MPRGANTREPVPDDVSALLRAWTDGDQRALAQLPPIVYGQLHRLAHHYLKRERAGHSLQTTALVNEAYIRLVDYKRMGEVYRARDLRLGRDVAIKILPDVFTRDPERLARFEREARVLAALTHPNIGAIYGVEDPAADSGPLTTPALLLELVEGDTLAERIARSARDSGFGRQRGLSMVEAVKIAAQIADALEAAHDKGIVHRDLKPANVKITPAGVVKVLDFGLAKAGLDDDTTSHDISQSPTMTVDGTRAGMTDQPFW